MALIPFALLIPSVHDRVFDLYTNSGRSLQQGMNSWDWRLAAWRSSFEWIGRNPLLGYGLNSFMFFSPQFFNDQSIGTHNTYLQLLFEGGLLGFGVFIGLLVSVWRCLFQNWRTVKTRSSAIALTYFLSYVVICFADNLLYYLVLNWYVWFFVGYVLRDLQLSKMTAKV